MRLKVKIGRNELKWKWPQLKDQSFHWHAGAQRRQPQLWHSPAKGPLRAVAGTSQSKLGFSRVLKSWDVEKRAEWEKTALQFHLLIFKKGWIFLGGNLVSVSVHWRCVTLLRSGSIKLCSSICKADQGRHAGCPHFASHYITCIIWYHLFPGAASHSVSKDIKK